MTIEFHRPFLHLSFEREREREVVDILESLFGGPVFFEGQIARFDPRFFFGRCSGGDSFSGLVGQHSHNTSHCN